MIGGHPLSGVLQGAAYSVGRLSGWWERPEVKRAAISRERADGDFPTPWNYEARYIGIDGIVRAKSHEQMHHIMDQLNGLCLSRREWLTVQGHGHTQSTLVEADAAPYLYPETDKMARFELRFKASDPRKTGITRTADLGSSYVEAWHMGNYPATPTIDVLATGTTGGYRLIGRDSDGKLHVWEYTGSTPGTEEHTISFWDGRHLVGGVEQPSRLGRAEMFRLDPFKVMEVRIAPIGPGTVSAQMHYRDTWI